MTALLNLIFNTKSNSGHLYKILTLFVLSRISKETGFRKKKIQEEFLPAHTL